MRRPPIRTPSRGITRRPCLRSSLKNAQRSLSFLPQRRLDRKEAITIHRQIPFPASYKSDALFTSYTNLPTGKHPLFALSPFLHGFRSLLCTSANHKGSTNGIHEEKGMKLNRKLWRGMVVVIGLMAAATVS